MDAFLDFVQANVAYAPYAYLGLLLLAGFNVPISEDLMLLTSGILAAKNPHLKYEIFTGVFLGAYLSDLICYAFIGRYLGPKIFKIKFFSKMITPEKLNQINSFYEKFGMATLLVGRFIPFGIRNALFLTAGIGRMNAWKFALSDLIACTTSCVFFFWLYFTYGESVIGFVKQANIIIFGIFALTLIALYSKKRAHKKALEKTPTKT